MMLIVGIILGWKALCEGGSVKKGWCFAQFVEPTGFYVASPNVTSKAPTPIDSSEELTAVKEALAYEEAALTPVALPTGAWKTPVHVAMSICGDRGHEALISLKSAILHANTYTEYHFHLFTDGTPAVEAEFLRHVKRAKAYSLKGSKVNVHYHWVNSQTPLKVPSP